MSVLNKNITFEGLTYTLDDRDRVAAELTHQSGHGATPFANHIQRETGDEAFTIAATSSLVSLAGNVTSSRIVTMPAAKAGKWIRVIWEVEQAGNDRVFTRAGSDTFAGNIYTSVAGNAAGDGDVVAIANTTAAITVVDDTNIGSHLDFHCAVDGLWLVTGHLVVDAVGNVPTLA